MYPGRVVVKTTAKEMGYMAEVKIQDRLHLNYLPSYTVSISRIAALFFNYQKAPEKLIVLVFPIGF